MQVHLFVYDFVRLSATILNSIQIERQKTEGRHIRDTKIIDINIRYSHNKRT